MNIGVSYQILFKFLDFIQQFCWLKEKDSLWQIKNLNLVSETESKQVVNFSMITHDMNW